ncbi:MAG TPA: hypothetical protein VEX39_17040 [Thermoleophilaceae bacterium]|nr:hypothetical protein [Thermoleophilaceae bacterium]
MARRSLKPQLNQIRTWVRQGRTDAWIAHQLEVSAKDIAGFKREHDLAPGEEAASAETDLFGPRIDEDEPDLRAEDEAAVAAALEAEQDEPEEDEDSGGDAEDDSGGGEGDSDGDDGDGSGQRRRRRGRRGGRGRGRQRKALEGTFDHGEEGYGLWLDPAIQDDPLYAEHWRGHRPVTVTVEADRIVIERSGDADAD